MAERPETIGGLAGRAIGYAGFPQMPVGGPETPFDIARSERGEGLEEPGPDRARRPVLCDIFIGNSRQPDVVARPLRHPPIGRSGLACLTTCPTAFLAIVSRHPDSPAQSPVSIKSKRGSGLMINAFS